MSWKSVGNVGRCCHGHESWSDGDVGDESRDDGGRGRARWKDVGRADVCDEARGWGSVDWKGEAGGDWLLRS